MPSGTITCQITVRSAPSAVIFSGRRPLRSVPTAAFVPISLIRRRHELLNTFKNKEAEQVVRGNGG